MTTSRKLTRSKLKDALSWEHRWVRWCAGFIVWTLLGLSFALRSYLSALQANAQPSWKLILSGYLIDFYLWGLLSPIIFMLARRFELRRRLLRNLSIHALLSAVFSFLVLAIAAPVSWSLGFSVPANAKTLFDLFSSYVTSAYYLHMGMTIYWATLVVAHATYYYKGLREEETKAAQLATQLAQAQLEALKMQIHPHFLFNTLNSIAALLHKDVEAADVMLARLGDFLRLTLRRSNDPSVRFEEELEFIRCYLEIEHTRFQDRLIVEMDVEPQTLDVTVPNMILQPVVENAVRHGIARQTDLGRITIRAFKKQKRLIMQVEDNGPGLKTNGKPNGNSNSGIGLRNTRLRLKQFYGDDYEFKIANAEQRGGVVVTLDVPAVEDEG